MTGNIESRLKDLGYELPPTIGEDYYGTLYGTMKPYHIVGPVLHLSGHVPIPYTQDGLVKLLLSSKPRRQLNLLL